MKRVRGAKQGYYWNSIQMESVAFAVNGVVPSTSTNKPFGLIKRAFQAG